MNALRPSQSDCFPHGLWSLWEMMKDVELGEIISNLHSLVSLTSLSTIRDDNYRASLLPLINERLNSLLPHFEKLELVVPTQYVRDALELIRLKRKIDYQQLERITNSIVHTAQIECKRRAFFELSPDMARYYNAEYLFGKEVFDNLPSANDDIFEAGACLALGRPTACVMHLNRALECGLTALASNLGIEKKNDWGAYLRAINAELDKRAANAGARSEDEQFYAEAAQNFDRMRRAWRNPTMHPDKTYTQARAEEILLAVKSFMAHLATRLVEW